MADDTQSQDQQDQQTDPQTEPQAQPQDGPSTTDTPLVAPGDTIPDVARQGGDQGDVPASPLDDARERGYEGVSPLQDLKGGPADDGLSLPSVLEQPASPADGPSAGEQQGTTEGQGA